MTMSESSEPIRISEAIKILKKVQAEHGDVYLKFEDNCRCCTWGEDLGHLAVDADGRIEMRRVGWDE